MKYQSHLWLEEIDLAPSCEWQPPGPCWCLVRMEVGQGYWLAQGVARELHPGDVLIMPPTVTGSFRASQLSVVRFQYFRFCPDFMSGLLTLAERQQFDRIAAKALQAVRLIPASHPVAKSYAELQRQNEELNGMQRRCRMLEIVGGVFAGELHSSGAADSPTLSATKRIKVLLEHLTEEEFLNASADELASYCGCSLRHFSRLFLQHFGVSLRSRQTEMRLLKARRLLIETDSRVMTVAGSCGYRHLGVFNTLFKKRFGMTPTEWRRQNVHHATQPPGCFPAEPNSPSSVPGRKASANNRSVVTEK